MRQRVCAVWVVLFGLAAAAPALAHHSVSGVFDQGKQITLTGVITRIEWINPHVYVSLDVTGARRQGERARRESG
jgi:hypothetical protein